MFGLTTQQNFAFFIQVPGFTPDHAEVDFEQLYTQDEIRELTIEEFRDSLGELPGYTANSEGEPNGLPVNVVIVANGIDVLRALLRAGWYESTAGSSVNTDFRARGLLPIRSRPGRCFQDINATIVWTATR